MLGIMKCQPVMDSLWHLHSLFRVVCIVKFSFILSENIADPAKVLDNNLTRVQIYPNKLENIQRC